MSLQLKVSDVQKHNSRKSVWMVIKNDVYDVTSFLNEHPGGEDPLLEAAGMDATNAFEDVGHSADARAMLSKYKVGSLVPGEKCARLKPQKWMSSSGSSAACRCVNDGKSWRQSGGGKWKWILLALAAAVVAGFVYQKYS